ncbi:2'-5' RNA ligase family protein [Streptomyces sp. NPDC004031]
MADGGTQDATDDAAKGAAHGGAGGGAGGAHSAARGGALAAADGATHGGADGPAHDAAVGGAHGGGFRVGQTALVVRVPEADPAVGGWRERYDPSARAGVPAHVTVLVPFLDGNRLDRATRADLAALLAGRPAFDVAFRRCGRFPGVLYLVPEPDGPLAELSVAVAARWPEAPPYGGRFAGVVPHLTVADGQDEAVLADVEAALAARLPVASRVRAVDLMAFDGTRWHLRESFPLGR